MSKRNEKKPVGNAEKTTVYVPSSNRQGSSARIHTNPDCPYLQKAKRIREVSKASRFDDQPVCEWCRGNWTPCNQDNNRSYQEALEDVEQ